MLTSPREPQPSTAQHSANTALLGAVSEVFEQMLIQQQTFEGKPNHFLTADDHQRMTDLHNAIGNLQRREKVTCFIDRAASLLNEATKACEAISSEYRDLRKFVDTQTSQLAQASRQVITKEHAALYCLLKTNTLSTQAIQALSTFRLSPSDVSPPNAETLEPKTAGGTFENLQQALEACRLQTENALNRLATTAHQLTDSATTRANGTHFLMPTATTAGDSGNLIAPPLPTSRGSHAFLEFSKPPQLIHFRCSDALSFFLNVIEDVASGDIAIPAASKLKKPYNSFMAAIRTLDDNLSKLAVLPQETKHHLRQFATAAQTLSEELTPSAASGAVSHALGRFREAKLLHDTARQLVKYGDVSLGEELGDRAFATALGFIDETQFREDAASQKSKQATLRNAFAQAAKAASAHVGAKGFFRSLASDTKVIDKLLDEFYSHQWDLRVGAGTELSRLYIGYAQKLAEELSHETPKAPWFTLTAHMSQCKPRSIPQPAIFLNALCAMAMISEDLDPAEESVIRIELNKLYGERASDKAQEHLGAWKSMRRGIQRIRNIAQAIVDVQALSPGPARRELPRCLAAIAKADGELDSNETAAYYGFLSVLLRSSVESLDT